MTLENSELMLFDFTSRKWTELAGLRSGYPSWSHDSRYVYFQDWSNADDLPMRIASVRISDRQVETVVELNRIERLPIGTFVSWTGLAPDNSPLLARNVGASEIYGLREQGR